MQNFIQISFQQARSFYLVLILGVLVGLSACENPGSVGGDLTDPTSEVVQDTLIINGLTSVDATSYSGELDLFSAGSFDDPLFGSMDVTGYLKPNLPASSDTLKEEGEVLLRIMYNSEQVSGDTAGTQQFDLYQINQFWRDRVLKVDNELSLGQKLGEFSVGTEDSLMINLSDIAPQWVDEYRMYADSSKQDTTGAVDSAYVYDAHGLALVPQNSAKIIPLYRDSTRFFIQHPEADTFDVPLNRWGYYLDRGTNSSIPQISIPLHSTYESVLNFKSLGIEELDIQPPGLSRAELVLYENTPALEQSLVGEPSTTQRAKEQVAYLHLANPEGLPENIDPGAPLNNPTRLQGSYSAENGTFRFDVTRLVENIIRNGFPEDREFFITLPNDGVIKSTLIMTDDDQVPDGLKPKIIITSLKNIKN
ncbi:hypothetical protein [Fodinibius sp.]|uniref:hypothetical protein n=1 Tax=Fodinibius sp. TaxID=1872440 RepID=UPI002ACE04C1|nr:hypothetical protein [Fodinibius sp.]MDZ7658972.1 hypothetical protein [Fodinibius sp.]